MNPENPAVMTIAEVAEYLRIPRASVYKLAQKGKIPCQKVGRHWRFRREAVERWLEGCGGAGAHSGLEAPLSAQAGRDWGR
jgi:excisionase family DNA binding protein